MADKIEAAKNLTDSPEADAFAKALDLLGWKIIRQHLSQGEKAPRWPLHCRYDNCPDWAENGGHPPRPSLMSDDVAVVWGKGVVQDARNVTVLDRSDGFYVIHKGKTETTYLAGPYRREWGARLWMRRHGFPFPGMEAEAAAKERAKGRF
jgi:hypothetical protein